MAAGRFNYGTAQYVDPPEVVPVEGGLLDIAEVRTVDNGDPSLRGYRFESELINVQLGTVAGFTQNSTTAMAEGAGYTYEVSGDPFTVFGSAALDAGAGADSSEMTELAQKRLSQSEGLVVEQALWNGMLASQATIIRTGALSAKIGVGVLAEWYAQNVNGIGYWHAGRRVVNNVASMQLVKSDEGGAAEIGGGVLINGSGYFAKTTIGTTTPTADQAWLLISGKPLLIRGSVSTSVGFAATAGNNRISAFALRTYVPSVDGPVGAVLIDLTL